MADFLNPKNANPLLSIFGYVRDCLASVAKMFDGTTDSNVPVGAKKIDGSTKVVSQWNGSSWDAIGSVATVSAIDADSVTVSNLETDNFKTGVIVTTVGATGSDTAIPTEQAVREAIAAITVGKIIRTQHTAENISGAIGTSWGGVIAGSTELPWIDNSIYRAHFFTRQPGTSQSMVVTTEVRTVGSGSTGIIWSGTASHTVTGASVISAGDSGANAEPIRTGADRTFVIATLEDGIFELVYLTSTDRLYFNFKKQTGDTYAVWLFIESVPS